MRKPCPVVSVEATGNTTVCVVLPVNACIPVLATVNVVVPADVAVVVNQGTIFTQETIPSPLTEAFSVQAIFFTSNTFDVSRALEFLYTTAPCVSFTSN